VVAYFELPKRDDALKNPEVMAIVLREANTRGAQSPTLNAIRDAILALVAQQTPAEAAGREAPAMPAEAGVRAMAAAPEIELV
jgi:hypothetical protein